MSAELVARRSAAAAVLAADFRREAEAFVDDYDLTLPAPDYCVWAFRLATDLELLLAGLKVGPGPLEQLGAQQRPLFDVAAGADPLAMPANRIGEPDSLTGLGERAILRQALADAIAYREPQGTCADCDQHPAGLCEDHGLDLDRTDDYLALATALGIEIER